MIRLAVLGSGSKGCSIYVEADGYKMLVDAGFTRKELAKRLRSIGKDIEDIQDVFYTHAHSDHYLPGVFPKEITRTTFDFYGKEVVGPGVVVESFQVSHDTPCLGYTITDSSGLKVAIMTDTGVITETMLGHLLESNIIAIETNYDQTILENGSYTPELKARCLSETGHCRNECAAEAIRCVAWPGLKHIVALHLSAAHNEPSLVEFELTSACLESGGDPEIIISRQDRPTKMITIL